MSSFAGLEIVFHSVAFFKLHTNNNKKIHGKVNFPPFILLTRCSVLIPSNGGYPQSKVYIIIPVDHISHFSL